MPSADAPTFLLIGGTGQVGGELLPHLTKSGGRCVAPSSKGLDLASPTAIREAVRNARPTVIINAGGYTAVDRAESERDKAFAINAEGPAVLAAEAARLGALLVHFSTDYVFDGRKREPYVETDSVAPLSVYGQTKAAGEAAVTSAGGPHVIIRTSWVYGPRGTNFPRTMLRLARERAELRVVDDQVGAPTSAIFLARATSQIVSGWREGVPSGCYHLSASGVTSWYEFAKAVLDADPRRAEHVVKRIVPISTEEYGAPAKRPAYSVLDNGKIRRAFAIEQTGWKAQLSEVFAASA